MDSHGIGLAVYRMQAPSSIYSLVAFTHHLQAEQRTDRVIAERWDATFVLMDGEANAAHLDRLQANVPRQEAGRLSARELILSRANKSLRLFDHVVEQLALGKQPDAEHISSVGYLMRTTAVYGNGKFGIADREHIATRPEFAAPFQAEMLTVWMIRTFTIDLVEHIAKQRATDTCARLEPSIRRQLGVGNSTGLGMAPFLVNHPALLHRWIQAREKTLASVRSLARASPAALRHFAQLLSIAKLSDPYLAHC
jgi:hypothetical protein